MTSIFRKSTGGGTDGWNLSLETHPGWQGWLVVLIPQAEVNMAHHVKYAYWPK